jgi:hypothetical protein
LLRPSLALCTMIPHVIHTCIQLTIFSELELNVRTLAVTIHFIRPRHQILDKPTTKIENN